MQIQTGQTGRLAELAVQLAQATAKAAEARAELKKAERRSDQADKAVATSNRHYDLERLGLWGNSPDAAALLAPANSFGSFAAGKALAEAYGLGFGMRWADTKKIALHIRLKRGDAGAVERAAAAVRYFAPYAKLKNGLARFGVQHRDSDDFRLDLRCGVNSIGAAIDRISRHSCDIQLFGTLECALQHIQDNHWIEDIIDLPAGQELLG